ncbi:hypothetical protein Tco_0344557 [Tanacetum coccineum]
MSTPAVSRHSSTSSRNKETPKVLLLAWEKCFEIKHREKQHSQEDIQELIRKLLKDVQNISDELAEYINSPNWNRPAFYFDDDDDEESSIPVRDIISELPMCVAITPEEPDDSLSMRDEHLSTIPKTESNELIKSSVENLVSIPSESEDFFRYRIDDTSFSDEDVPKEIYSNPLFDEEIISDKIDASIISSPKIDSRLEQFSGELTHSDLIPPGINEADFDPEEDIRLVERLLYDNLSPRPPKEFNSENSDAIIDSFSPPPIPVKDSDSLMEEIDLFLTLDDSMPPGIKNDDYDSEGDILFLEELLSNDSPSLPENESSNLDHFNDPSSPRPPPEPPDVEVFFNFEPDTGVLTTKVVKGISEHYVLMPNILPTLPTLDPDLDFTPSHDSLGSGNKIFDPGIFIEVQSERLLSRDEFSISFIRDPLSLVFDSFCLHVSSKTRQSVQRSSPVIHQPPQETSVEILQAKEDLMISIETFLKKFNRISFRETPKVLLIAWEKFFEIKHRENQHSLEDIHELIRKLLEDVQNISEELTEYINSPSWNRHAFYFDDDDDEESSIPMRDIISELPLCVAITPEEPDDSLSMGDEHLSTIPKMKSDKLIKSSVENLVPILSESEDFYDIESECDVPFCDNSTTFSNPLFDANDDFSSSDDKSFSDEDVLKEIYSNPLFDEEIISDKIDASIISSPKIDSHLEQFSGELTHIDLIPPGINEADFDPEEDIRLVERLLYDNLSPRPPEEFNSKNSDAIIYSFFPPPILVEDSDSLTEEIDLFLTLDDSMPPGIENDDYDSEGDILFLEELISNDSPSLPKNESSNLDHFNDPSSPRPPPEPIDVEVFFDFEPDTGVLTTKVVKGISEHYVPMPNILPTLPTLDPNLDFTPSHDSLGSGNKIFDPGIFIEVQSERLLSRDEFSISFFRDPLSLVFDTLLPFSSENEDKVFNLGILISPLLSHRGKITSNFYKSPMMITGGDIPLLDVPYLHFYPP